MQATAIDDFGAPPAVHELSEPEPGENEVLVRVHASSVNGFDLAVAGGALKGMMEHRFPIVLGKDFAGAVESTGPGVTNLRTGDIVFGVLMRPTLGDGTFAQYVAANEAYAARVPQGLEIATAGALGLAGAAALDAVEAIDPRPGETILISGATGGVGGLAVQLAAARGAQVIATAHGGDEERHVRELGAHETVDHTGNLRTDLLVLRPNGVDAAIHLAGDGLELSELVIDGGRIASTIGLSQAHVGERDIQVTTVRALPVTATLERLAEAVVAGDLRLPIQNIYSLAQVPEAFAAFGAGTRGKLVVAID